MASNASPKVALERHPKPHLARLLQWVNPNRYADRASIARFPSFTFPIVGEVLASRDAKLVLVKNSKAGCTTAAQLIHFYEFGELCRDDVHHAANGLLQGLPNAPLALKALFDESTAKITSVRHPLDRAVSAYHDFFIDQKNYHSKRHLALIEAFGFDANRGDTYNFDVFLDYVCASMEADPDYTDRHFRHQCVNTCWDHVSYAYVWRIEDGFDAFRSALIDLGLASDRLPSSGFSGQNRTQSTKYLPSQAQSRKIAELYAPDFEALGYSEK